MTVLDQDALRLMARIADAAERMADALEKIEKQIFSVVGSGDNGRNHVRTYQRNLE